MKTLISYIFAAFLVSLSITGCKSGFAPVAVENTPNPPGTGVTTPTPTPNPYPELMTELSLSSKGTISYVFDDEVHVAVPEFIEIDTLDYLALGDSAYVFFDAATCEYQALNNENAAENKLTFVQCDDGAEPGDLVTFTGNAGLLTANDDTEFTTTFKLYRTQAGEDVPNYTPVDAI